MIILQHIHLLNAQGYDYVLFHCSYDFFSKHHYYTPFYSYYYCYSDHSCNKDVIRNTIKPLFIVVSSEHKTKKTLQLPCI